MKLYEKSLHKINNGDYLSRTESYESMKSVSQSTDINHVRVQMGLLLYGLSVRKPSVDEVLGLCDFVRDVEPGLTGDKLHSNKAVLGLSGSGKKGIKTFNISTPATLVSAVAGAYIAKPASKATSSITGSSDLLSMAGASLNVRHSDMMEVLEETGIGVFSIENTIPKFDQIYGGNFYVPHALSYALAAFSNPVKCDYTLYGFTGKNVDTSARVLKELGFESGCVFSSTQSGNFYIDEVTPLSTNLMALWEQERDIVVNKVNIFDEFGCPKYGVDDLKPGRDEQEQLEIFSNCLSGSGTSAQMDTIALNAALIIKSSGLEEDSKKAFRVSKDIIMSGEAVNKLAVFCEKTSSLAKASIKPE